MKATGMVRRVDDLGRVVLPKELRQALKIQEGDPIEIFVDNKSIVLKKYEPGCVLCSNLEETANIQGILVCKSCAKEIAKAFFSKKTESGAKK